MAKRSRSLKEIIFNLLNFVENVESCFQERDKIDDIIEEIETAERVLDAVDIYRIKIVVMLLGKCYCLPQQKKLRKILDEFEKLLAQEEEKGVLRLPHENGETLLYADKFSVNGERAYGKYICSLEIVSLDVFNSQSKEILVSLDGYWGEENSVYEIQKFSKKMNNLLPTTKLYRTDGNIVVVVEIKTYFG